MKRSQNRKDPLTAAFSLVEMAMALGIIAFAMVGIIGVIPIGLDSFRGALNLSVETTIAQQLASEIQRSESGKLESQMNGQPDLHYFDEEGVKVPQPSAIFVAEVLPPVSVQSGGILNPNAPARSVVIRISNQSAPLRTASYSILIPEEPGSPQAP